MFEMIKSKCLNRARFEKLFHTEEVILIVATEVQSRI